MNRAALAIAIIAIAYAEWVRAPVVRELRAVRAALVTEIAAERTKVRTLTKLTGRYGRKVERDHWRLRCLDNPMPCLPKERADVDL